MNELWELLQAVRPSTTAVADIGLRLKKIAPVYLSVLFVAVTVFMISRAPEIFKSGLALAWLAILITAVSIQGIRARLASSELREQRWRQRKHVLVRQKLQELMKEQELLQAKLDARPGDLHSLKSMDDLLKKIDALVARKKLEEAFEGAKRRTILPKFVEQTTERLKRRWG